MARFAKLASAPAKPSTASKLSPEMKTAIEQGMADAWASLAGFKKELEEERCPPAMHSARGRT